MSTTETPPPQAPVQPGPPERRCPRCGSTLATDQEWCLNCGAAAETEVVEARGWRVPLYLGGGLVALAVIGVILAIVALASRNDVVAIPTRRRRLRRRLRPGRRRRRWPRPRRCRARRRTRTPRRPCRRTRTRPRRSRRTRTPPLRPRTPRRPSRRRPRPRRRTGTGSTFPDWSGADGDYTIIIESAKSRSQAETVAQQAQDAGMADVGILDSSSYSSLNGGYQVVFTGVYTSKSDAEDALSSAPTSSRTRTCGRSRPRRRASTTLRGAHPPAAPAGGLDVLRVRRGLIHQHRHQRGHRLAQGAEVVAALEHEPQRRADPVGARRSDAAIPANPASLTRQVASGSSRWASKPALTSTSSGSHDRISPHATCSTSERYAASPLPPGTGRFTVYPTRAGAHVGLRPGPRIQRRLVDRHEQDIGVRVEDVVGAVAVVDVPVDDHHPREPVRSRGAPRGDRDVVEEAEPHPPRGLGVVPGRAQRAHARRRLAAQQRVDQPHGPAARPQRGPRCRGPRTCRRRSRRPHER